MQVFLVNHFQWSSKCAPKVFQIVETMTIPLSNPLRGDKISQDLVMTILRCTALCSTTMLANSSG